MKSTSAVVFPDTVPAARVLIPLVLVFEPVVYCQPVENDDQDEPLDPLCQKILDNSLCTLHVPAPLAESRGRFLHLVKDLRQRRDDYAAQLAHVSLAGLSTGSKSGSESRSSILSRLLSRHGIEDPGQEMRDKLLWQARLVLKLGEQYDTDQRNLAESLQHIHQREQKLFSGVSDDAANLFRLTGSISTPAVDTDRMQRLRLKAWARLFAFGSCTTPGTILVTADPDAVDRLCEEYERFSGTRPAPMAALALPAFPADLDGFLDARQQFQRQEQNLLADLQGLLDNHSIPEGLAKEWENAVATTFPSSVYGRCQLVLYIFSGVRIKQLLLDSFGHDEDELEAALADEPPLDVVVGLLQQQ